MQIECKNYSFVKSVLKKEYLSLSLPLSTVFLLWQWRGELPVISSVTLVRILISTLA